MPLELYMCDYKEVYKNVTGISSTEWDYTGWEWVTGTDVYGAWAAIFSDRINYLNTSVMITKNTINLNSFSSLYFSRVMGSSNKASITDPSGKLDIFLLSSNGNEFKIYEENGPVPWEALDPIKLFPGSFKLGFRYTPIKKLASDGVTETTEGTVAQLGGLMIKESKKINCRVVKYESPKSLGELKEISILRGVNRYQQLKDGGTEIRLGLMFDNYLDYKDFCVNLPNKPFIFIDKDGVSYRGLIDPGEFDGQMVGNANNGYYYRDIVLKCGQKLGVGW